MPEFYASYTPSNADDFTAGYMDCAEFTFTDSDDDGREVTRTVRGWSARALKWARADCAAFQKANAAELARYYELSGRSESHAGHDFWLTRNGHGAGFWDRGNDPVFESLTQACRPYAEVDVYRTDSAWLDFS